MEKQMNRRTIYITPAGRAAFHMVDACAASAIERRKVSLEVPAWFKPRDEFTPTDGGASACIEHVQ